MEPSTERRRHSWSMSEQPGNNDPVPAKACKADAMQSRGWPKLNTRSTNISSHHSGACTARELATVMQDF